VTPGICAGVQRARHRHIAALARIAPPRIAAVLNVARAQPGEFGSRDAIAIAKGELVEALPAAAPAGFAVLTPTTRWLPGCGPERPPGWSRSASLRRPACGPIDVRWTGAAGGVPAATATGAADRPPWTVRRPPRTGIAGGPRRALELGLPLDEVAAGLARPGRVPGGGWRSRAADGVPRRE